MKRVLIAVSSEVISEALAEELGGEWEVYTCADAESAAKILRCYQPDGLIVDLNIGPKGGLELLAESLPFLPPVVMALSTYINADIVQTAMSMGVGCTVFLPCTVGQMKRRFLDMAQAYRKSPAVVAGHLRALGVSTRLDGYLYLKTAVLCCDKRKGVRLHKELYPLVAEICQASDIQCVEQAIRAAIQAAWEKRDLQVWARYFTLNEEGDVDCPCNKEFILSIEEKL